jgi:hypothetical protein
MNPYKAIRLTAEQKQKMARSIQQPSKKKINVQFIIYPAFIATALFLIFLWTNGSTTQPTILNQATSEVLNREGTWTQEVFILRIIVLWGVSLALLMTTYVVVLLIAIKPKNSIYYKTIRYVHEKITSRKLYGIAITPIVILVVYTSFVLITPWPDLVLQAVILLISASLYFYLSVFLLRKSELEHKCPSCQKALTNKEISWGKKCSACKNKFEVRAIGSFQPGFLPIMLTPVVLNDIDFNQYLIIGYFVLITLATVKIFIRHIKIEQPK